MDGFEGNNGIINRRGYKTVPIASTRPVGAQAVSTAKWWSTRPDYSGAAANPLRSKCPVAKTLAKDVDLDRVARRILDTPALSYQLC